MGKDLAMEFKACKRVFDEIDEKLRFNLQQLMFEGPKDQLQLTEFTQPALVAHSMAILQVLKV